VECELDLGGITKLIGCGHTFCRRDLAQWILSGHGSCPICRHVFLDIVEPPEPETSDDDYTPSSDLEYGGDSGSDWMDADQEWEDDVDESEHPHHHGSEDENVAPNWPAGGYEDAALEEHYAPEFADLEEPEDDEPFRIDVMNDPDFRELYGPFSDDIVSDSRSSASNSHSSSAGHSNHEIESGDESSSSSNEL